MSIDLGAAHLKPCGASIVALGDKSALEVEDGVGAFNAAAGQRLVGSHVSVQRKESYLRIEIPPLRLLDPEVVYVLSSHLSRLPWPAPRSPLASTPSLSARVRVPPQVRRRIRQHVVGVHHRLDDERCAPGCVSRTRTDRKEY